MNLNNGAKVLASKPSKLGHIVLALFNSSYVTWFVKNGDAYWGHYYNNQEEALNDFNNRD